MECNKFLSFLINENNVIWRIYIETNTISLSLTNDDLYLIKQLDIRLNLGDSGKLFVVISGEEYKLRKIIISIGDHKSIINNTDIDNYIRYSHFIRYLSLMDYTSNCKLSLQFIILPENDKIYVRFNFHSNSYKLSFDESTDECITYFRYKYTREVSRISTNNSYTIINLHCSQYFQ